MRHSRKKISVDDIPLLSVTQKLREKNSKLHFRRDCCEKQNHSRKQSSQSRAKEPNSSTKKSLKKKKYFEDEVQKVLQRRILNEEYKFNQIRLNNANEIEDLKGDMQAMKEVINKLSLEEWNSKQSDKNNKSEEERKEIQMMREGYLKKIDEVTEALQIQRQINSKLEEAHIQSQLFAKQTKDYSENINRQLSQLAQKHIACQAKAKALQQSTFQVRFLQAQLEQMNHKFIGSSKEKEILQKISKENHQTINKISLQKTNLEQEMLKYQQTYNQIQQDNTTLFNQNRQLADTIKTLQQQLQSKGRQLENLTSQLSKVENQLSKTKDLSSVQMQKMAEFKAQTDNLQKEKQQAEEKLSKLQADFNNTKNHLGHTEIKLKGLVSMQKKCEQLYSQIKRQKQRWDHFNIDSVHQKQTLQRQLNEYKQQQIQLTSKLKIAQRSKKEAFDQIQKLKKENKQLNKQKNQIERQIGQYEERIKMLEGEVEEIEKQKQELSIKLQQCQQILQVKENSWAAQKAKFQSKLQWLEKQKTQIQYEVKGTLEVAKKRNDQIQSINQELRSEITTIQQQKNKLESIYKKMASQLAATSSEIEVYKTAIGSKESKIIQLQFKVTQLQQNLETEQAKSRQLQTSQRNSNLQWNNKYNSICNKLDSCLQQLKDCKQINVQLEQELTYREEKINNLSTIRQDLQQRLITTQSRLRDSETARLSLTSEYQDYQLLTMRNEESHKEDKDIYEIEINKKNKIIQELRQTIKSIKEESFKIQEQMSELRKLQEFEDMATQQMQYIHKSLKSLTEIKNQLTEKIAILTGQNQKLAGKLGEMERIGLSWVETQQKYSKDIETNQIEKQHLQDQLAQENQKLRELQNLFKKSTEKAQLDKIEAQQKLADTVRTLNQVRLSFNESHKNTAQLISTIKQKEAKIEQLTNKLTIFQEKKRKVVNEVHGIQNQISEMGLRNNMLEERNRELENDIKNREQKLTAAIQKSKLLIEANAALEEQILALSEQAKILRDQVNSTKQTSRLNEEKSHRSLSEVYEICEARKSQALNHVNSKLQQLANELNLCINKLNAKNKQLETCQKKCQELKQIIEEKQRILTVQKNRNQQSFTVINQLNNQIESYKCQINSKERQIETFNREKTIMREKLVEQQSKYEILRRKFDNLQHQKTQSQREIQNQNISLRVLREQNKNIEKVMTEQINQRKAIIEQLVNEKKMLYCQLQHER